MSALICDVETLAQPAEVILANLPPWSEEEALTRKGNRSKPETISAFLEEDKANHGKDAIEKAALNPETATIAIVGFYRGGKVEQLVVDQGVGASSSSSGDSRLYFDAEAELLEHAFLRITDGTTFVGPSPVLGWNLVWDVKMLVRRAWILGVRVPSSIFSPLSRYPMGERFVDMMDRFRAGSFKDPYTGLNNALKAMGLPEKGDGKEFGKLWQEDRAKALEYNATELRGQAELYRRMGVDL